MHTYWAGANALSPSWSFLPKAKELEGEGENVFVGFMVVVFLYILLLQWQSLLISSVTFPVPSQLRRGMGNTLVHTEKKRKSWKERNHGKVAPKEKSQDGRRK